MLIVYQSLESTGTKNDEPSTFITGNSFKRRVHESLQPLSFHSKDRVWDGKQVTFSTARLKPPVASAQASKALSEKIKKLSRDERDKEAVQMLAKIVERIADNASACTRPRGNQSPFVRRPDIIVLGEMYASSLKGQVLSGYVVLGGIDPTGDARHRFTVLAQTGLDGKTPAPGCLDGIETILYGGGRSSTNKDENSKCMLIKVRGWLIAFVHTPNSIRDKPERAAQYLDNNAQRFGTGAKLDLVIGDTNQPSSDTVQSYMNARYNRLIRRRGQWRHSVMSNSTQVVRGYRNYEVSGTNSNYKNHFDIACTSEAHVSLSGLTVHDVKEDELIHEHVGEDPVFLFHGLTDKFIEWGGEFYAYSDHNGVIVEVLRDKPDFQLASGARARSRVIDDFRRKRLKLE